MMQLRTRGIVINNLGGNKLDYYLRREIEYAADGCRGDTRESTVTVRLSNTAPDAPLPEYVASIGGLPPGLATNIPPGTNVTSVSLVATTGAKKLKGGLSRTARRFRSSRARTGGDTRCSKFRWRYLVDSPLM